ncbi:unnamed protein product [Protopolystoma xenopodis]|uniref:Uncharacterized protein n=1 Tax=Protopolystoma xenopodis TaxID=117903 RepID=A0A3S4ZS04_9PLAT|nr:unnamed protein product [Protopolystoma xenopodis]
MLRLTEAEMDRARLRKQLEKERSERDELESLFEVVRDECEQASNRARDAEIRLAKAEKLLTDLRDQTDELAECKAQLVVAKEDNNRYAFDLPSTLEVALSFFIYFNLPNPLFTSKYYVFNLGLAVFRIFKAALLRQ